MRDAEFARLLERAMDGIAAWEARWRPFARDESLEVSAIDALAAIDALVGRLADNYPFFHPSYAGQMLKPPHPIALAAYAAAARINPNNHALDGGPASAALEREAVDQIAQLFGYGHDHLGHLSSSGTFANIEALWVTSRLRPGKSIAFSTEAHYTHARMCELLGIKTVVVPVDPRGRIELDALRALPRSASVGAVVLSAGTTATGAIDSVHEVVELARERDWRVHVDAAYGGFFKIIAELPEAGMDPAPWRALAGCDSIVVDPHKHGLQPYGCGCVLFADASVGTLYKHDSPYTYFTSKALHLGEISLECSRAGAAAAALWTTLRCLPLTPDGLGRSLLKSRQAARRAFELARQTRRLEPVVEPELDIFTVAPMLAGVRTRASRISERTEMIFQSCQLDGDDPLYLAKWRLPQALGGLALPHIEWDQDEAVVIRSVLMKPEHERRVDKIVDRLAAWED